MTQIIYAQNIEKNNTQVLRKKIFTFHISNLEPVGSFRAPCMFNRVSKGGVKE